MEPAVSKNAPVTLPGLTSLRGVGALWVVVYHAQYKMGLPVAQAGYLGVDLFFILSGFVLCHAHTAAPWNGARYRHFLRRRFARIFPMHWAALILLAATLVLYPKVYLDMPARFHLADFITSWFLMQSWGFGPLRPWNVPAWSLSTEWLVSILFPLFAICAGMVTSKRWAVVLPLGCLLFFQGFLVLTHNPDPDVGAKAGVVRTFCEFGAGCLLYRAYDMGVRAGSLSAVIGATLITLGILTPSLAMAAVAGFLVLVLLAADTGSPVAKALATRTLAFLGEISYSIYLLHFTLLQVSNRLRKAVGISGAGSLIWFSAFLFLLICFSTATYRIIEVPARRWLRTPSEMRIKGQPQAATP